MARILPSLLIMASLLLLPAVPVLAADRDQDLIDDLLEHKLALKFAPEWRFNFAVAGDGSTWNNNEANFPSSVEWFHNHVRNEEGHNLQVCFYDVLGTNRRCVSISDMERLPDITDPVTNRRTDDPYWGANDGQNRNLVRIENYREWIGGYPETFPTYFECYQELEGKIGIAYWLWYPWDWAPSPFFGAFEGSHRSDWENAKVTLSAGQDLASNMVDPQVQIERVTTYNHFGKVFYEPVGPSSRLNFVEGTHPQIYVVAGTNGTYPTGGEWHDPGAWYNPYDDFFHGNGLVAQAWRGGRELVNLGEYDDNDDCSTPSSPCKSFKRWIRFQGMWGPDGAADQGSSLSPPFKGRWGRSGGSPARFPLLPGIFDDPAIDTEIPPPGGFNADGERRALLVFNDHWRSPVFIPTISLSRAVQLNDLGGLNDEVTSIFLLGGAQVRLFVDSNGLGPQLDLRHSCEHIGEHFQHGFNDAASSAQEISKYELVYADGRNSKGYQTGSSTAGPLNGPLATLGRAQFLVEPSGTVVLEAGGYPEVLILDKKITITSQHGIAVVGAFPYQKDIR